MRKFIFASMFLGIGFLAGQLFQMFPKGIALGSGGAATTATLNGDCDGNGTRELTDGIYLINWLFLGGPEPAPIQGNPTSQVPPPPLEIHCVHTEGGIEMTWANPTPYEAIEIKKNGQTLASLTDRESAYFDTDFKPGEVIDYSLRGEVDGVVSASVSCSVAIPPPPVLGQCLVASNQTKCWGTQSWIDCGAPPAKGQDGAYRLGCPTEGRFTDNGDGTVTDRCTGLMWTTRFIDVDGDFEFTAKDLLNWKEAMAYVENLDFLGHDDWRIPNIEELHSIIDYGNECQSSVFYSPFEFRQYNLWSSTSAFCGGAWSAGPPYDSCFGQIAVFAGSTERTTLFAAVRTAN